jgi:hypothetical protein
VRRRRGATATCGALLVAATALAGCARDAACAPVGVTHSITVRADGGLPAGATMELGCESEGGCWAEDPPDWENDPTVRVVGVTEQHRPRTVSVRVVDSEGAVLEEHEPRVPWQSEPMGCGTRWSAEITIDPVVR